MVVIDTSAWIDHFRREVAAVRDAIRSGTALVHPFVVGEIALGRHRMTDPALQLLADLPQAMPARVSDVLALIQHERLGGSGLGYVDVAVLASVKLLRAGVITHDRRMARVAAKLGLPMPHPPPTI